jgi:glycosyltransferase involved in cell wall biosynthesis
MTGSLPRISFGIIVFNGEPFLRYCLRSLYPFAHEIIVVEGACASAKTIATQEGHSTDNTLQTLYSFKSEEDSENKLRIVTRDGFWTEKDEQSQAYAQLASGNYLWQVDIDEFYDPEEMSEILNFLRDHPEISMVSFKQITFWGGFDFTCDGWYLRRGAEIYNRVFRWGPGYRYVSHRPPTVVDQSGQDMRKIRPVILDRILKKPVRLYHYSLLFPKQVMEKCEYYRNVDWTSRKEAVDWANEVFLDLKQPFRVHNVYQYPSWLDRFSGKHPPQIEELKKDLRAGKVKIETRKTDDIEMLLDSRSYQLGRLALKMWDPVDQNAMPVMRRIQNALRHPLRSFNRILKRNVKRIQ